jgi:hypothetical protein
VDSRPLAFTDSELDIITRHAGVLPPGLRRAFVERVAYELRGQVVGDGLVYRMCPDCLIRRCWRPATSASGGAEGGRGRADIRLPAFDFLGIPCQPPRLLQDERSGRREWFYGSRSLIDERRSRRRP